MVMAAPRCWPRATRVGKVGGAGWSGAQQLQRIEIVEGPYGLATGDFDGDGWVDFAVANDGVDRSVCF